MDSLLRRTHNNPFFWSSRVLYGIFRLFTYYSIQMILYMSSRKAYNPQFLIKTFHELFMAALWSFVRCAFVSCVICFASSHMHEATQQLPILFKEHLLIRTFVCIYTNFCHLIFITTNHDLYSFYPFNVSLSSRLQYCQIAACWLSLWSGVFIYFGLLIISATSLCSAQVILQNVMMVLYYYYYSCYYNFCQCIKIICGELLRS